MNLKKNQRCYLCCVLILMEIVRSCARFYICCCALQTYIFTNTNSLHKEHRAINGRCRRHRSHNQAYIRLLNDRCSIARAHTCVVFLFRACEVMFMLSCVELSVYKVQARTLTIFMLQYIYFMLQSRKRMFHKY